MSHDAERRLSRLAATQHGVFTRAQATGVGLSHGQIDRRVASAWVQVYDGVYRAAGAPVTWRGDLRAALFAAGEGAAISHRAAAALYGLPGGRNDLAELTCRRWDRTIHDGLVVHESRRLDARDITEVDGLAVTTAERLLLDLAWLRPSANYLEMVIHAARRKRLITYSSTHATFLRHARRGLRGVKALREALERWDPDQKVTESEMEIVLFQILREHDLPLPVTQFVARDDAGRFIARTDLGWPELKITLDYDSKQEHSDEFQLARDTRRRNDLIAAGYLPLGARHADILNGAHVLCTQLRAILRRSA